MYMYEFLIGMDFKKKTYSKKYNITMIAIKQYRYQLSF